jgi:cytochrome c2
MRPEGRRPDREMRYSGERRLGYAGIKDAQERADLIAYLKDLGIAP